MNDIIFKHVDPLGSNGLGCASKMAIEWLQDSKKFKYTCLNRNYVAHEDCQRSSSFLFYHWFSLSSSGCDRTCRKRDTKIYLGISNDKRPKWLIEIFIKGARTIIEGSSLIDVDNDNPECVDVSTSFSLVSFAETIYTSLLINKELNFLTIFIITDGLFSQVWYMNYLRLKNNEDWAATLQDRNQNNCRIV